MNEVLPSTARARVTLRSAVAGLLVLGLGCAATVPPESAAEPHAVELIRRAIPAQSARVVAASAARKPGMATVVLIRTAHLNEAPNPELGLPRYDAVERGKLVPVLVQAFETVVALVEAGHRVVVAEGTPWRVGDEQLATMAGLGIFPDVAEILGASAPQRRGLIVEALQRGSNLDLSLAVAAAFGPTVVVEGVESDETILRMLKIGAELTAVELGLARPEWRQLAAAVRSGRADEAERERYTILRRQALDVIDRFVEEVIGARDRELVDGALALAVREGADTVLLPAGGFHTPGMLAELEVRGAGYVVIEPIAYADAAPTLDAWRDNLVRRLPAPP